MHVRFRNLYSHVAIFIFLKENNEVSLFFDISNLSVVLFSSRLSVYAMNERGGEGEGKASSRVKAAYANGH